jgi:hypothetical protein
MLGSMSPLDWVESSVRMREALAGLNGAELAGLVEEIRKNPKAAQQQGMLYGAIAKAWAETDLEGALEFGLGAGGDMLGQAFLPAAVLELSKSDPGRAERLIKATPNPDMRMNLMSQLASVLVEDSPEKAIRLVMEGGGRQGSWMMNNIYHRWASADLESARAFLPKITNSEDRHGAVQAVARAMAAEDLEGALAWMNGLGSLRDRTAALQTVASQLVMTDVSKALDLVKSMPANGQRAEVMAHVMQAWMQTDREAAMAWLEQVESPFEKNRILSNIGWQLGNGDPVGTIDMALEMKSANQARNLLQSAMQSLPDEAIADTVAKVTGMPEGRLKETAMNQLVQRWARADPVEAMRFASALPGGRDYDRSVRNAAHAWAAEDGAAAANWAIEIGDEERRKAAIGGVIDAWSEREPEAAAKYLSGLGDQKLLGDAVPQLASTWGQSDPDAAMAWAESLDGDARGKAVGTVIGSIAGHDPQKAMAMFDAAVISEIGETEAKQVAQNIAGNLGQWDAEMAVEWAAGLPEGLQADAVGNAFGQWVEHSPVAASEWLVDVPAGEMKDRATMQLVQSIERTDPESAFVWAASVGNPDQRVELITRVAGQWGKQDEAAAIEAVLTTDLSDEQKAQILKGFE